MTVKEHTTFGVRLKRLRVTAGLTQEALAEHAGMSAKAVSDLERDPTRRPRLESVTLLADALRLPPKQHALFLAAARPDSTPTTTPIPTARPLRNLPKPLTPLFGRAGVATTVADLLRRGEVRLLTLLGPGGVGKTRLAIEVAERMTDDFAEGVVFMDLAPLRDPALVIPGIAQRLGLEDRAGLSVHERLTNYLGKKQLLLVLDNFEHVIEAREMVLALLEACPCLVVLTTSRVALRVRGEREYRVAPLALPEESALPEALARSPAVELFLDRAQAAGTDLALNGTAGPVLAEICRRLDGLPLAIELAAAWTRLLLLQQLLARLADRLPMLVGGSHDLPARQKTMRDAIAWSYELLDAQEQALFRQLSAFAGGCTLDAAEAVCVTGGKGLAVLHGLAALVDHSLLGMREDEQGETRQPRFWMLETIREFGLERLEESGQSDSVGQRHTEYYLSLAESAAPQLVGPDQARWLDRIDEDLANVRTALDRLTKAGDMSGVLRLGGALSWFWFVRGHLTEGRAWIECALVEEETRRLEIKQPTLVARARLGAGKLALFQGDLAAARVHLEASAALCRAAGVCEPGGRAARVLLTEALGFLVVVCNWTGQSAAAAEVIVEYEETVDALDDPRTSAWRAFNLGRLHLYQSGDPVTAQAYLQEAEITFQDLEDVWHLAQLRMDLGMAALWAGDLDGARTLFEESLVAARSLKERQLEAAVLNNLGELDRLSGQDETATEYYTASLRIYQNFGDKAENPRLLHNLGYVALHTGDVTVARARFARSLAESRSMGMHRGIAEGLAGLAAVAAHRRTAESGVQAARLWAVTDAIHTTEGTRIWPADRAERARYEAIARQTLGSKVFEAAYSDGRALAMEQAIAEALSV